VLAIWRETSGDFGQTLLACEAALKLLPNETAVAAIRADWPAGDLEICIGDANDAVGPNGTPDNGGALISRTGS